MKKIKEKMTVVSADGKVTFYLEKRSDVYLYDCLHLDVIQPKMKSKNLECQFIKP